MNNLILLHEVFMVLCEGTLTSEIEKAIASDTEVNRPIECRQAA